MNPEFTEKGVTILGISADGMESHLAFRDKHQLPFPLLSDEDHAVCEAYGVWGERHALGRTFFGIARSSFLIDEHGQVAAIWRNVNPVVHPAEVLATL